MAFRTAYANFLTGDYIVNSTIETFLGSFDNAGNPGNPIVNASGLLTEDNTPTFISTPRAIGDMAAELASKLSTGITFIGQFQIGAGWTGGNVFYFGDALAHNGLTVNWNDEDPGKLNLLLLSSHLDLSLSSVAAGSTNQIAFIYNPSSPNLYVSVNGSSNFIGGSNSEAFGSYVPLFMYNAFGLGIPNGWIKYFGIYDASVPISLLPSLSVPGFVPPPVIGGGGGQTQPFFPLRSLKYNNGLWR